MQTESLHRPKKDSTLQQDVYAGKIDQHIFLISRELRDGFELLKKYPRSVTIFGSSLMKPEHPCYGKAEELGRRIVTELKYAVITGGGPGIMEAAAKGASSVDNLSAGLAITLPHEHHKSAGNDGGLRFRYFFTRKAMLTFAAESFVFFPGGFGTFDELFSILTLMQTGKIPRVPILLYDFAFWGKMEAFIMETMLEKYKTVDEKDLKLFEITDSLDYILDRVREAPVSEWWRHLN